MEKVKERIFSLKNARGGIGIITLMIVIIILAGIFLVGGIFPKPSTTDPNAEKFTVIPEIPLDSRKSLQLKTIKFNSCTSTAAVDFLVDRSGSMRYGTKLQIFPDIYFRWNSGNERGKCSLCRRPWS